LHLSALFFPLFSFLLIDYIQTKVFATKICCAGDKKAPLLPGTLFPPHLITEYVIRGLCGGFLRAGVNVWRRVFASL
jgi:hypothetical protein